MCGRTLDQCHQLRRFRFCLLGISEAAELSDWAHKIERSACLRSFPFRKELGRPRMVVPTVFELGIPRLRPLRRLRRCPGQVGVETRSRVPPRLRDADCSRKARKAPTSVGAQTRIANDISILCIKPECGFEVGSLGRAASPRPPSWAIGHTELSAGVLGTARPT